MCSKFTVHHDFNFAIASCQLCRPSPTPFMSTRPLNTSTWSATHSVKRALRLGGTAVGATADPTKHQYHNPVDSQLCRPSPTLFGSTRPLHASTWARTTSATRASRLGHCNGGYGWTDETSAPSCRKFRILIAFRSLCRFYLCP